MKSLFILVTMCFVLAFSAYASETNIPGPTKNGAATEIVRSNAASASVLGDRISIVEQQDSKACFADYHPCSTDSDCCGRCMKYGNGLFCR